jgi:hypothetical protein
VSSGKYAKPKRPCPYCGVLQAKLNRHLTRNHAKEEDVATALYLKGKDQQKAFEALRKKGIFKVNQECVQSGNIDSIIRERKASDSKVALETKMCGSCLGFFSKATLWKHKRTCNGSLSEPIIPSVPITLLSKIDDETDATFSSRLLPSFRQNPVGDICRKDWVVQTIGSHQWAKTVKDVKTGTMTSMRRMGHLILECREVIRGGVIRRGHGQTEFSGEDIFHRRNFNVVNQALMNLTRGGEKGPKNSLKMAMTYLLKSSGETIRAIYLIREEDDKAEEVRIFLDILNSKWKTITSKAAGAIQMRSLELLRRPIQLPLDEDIICIKDYTLSAIEDLLKDDNKHWSLHDFNHLRTLLVCRLTMFNARRGGEPARLLLGDWHDADKGAWIDPRAANKLPKAEKLLLGIYKVAYMPGKGLKLVPVLFPEDLIAGIRKIESLREEMRINPLNKYLFPATRGSTMHVFGNQCIAAVCESAGVNEYDRLTGAKEVSRVTATKMRHRASTVYAALDVPEKDRRAFYKHMGHSADINSDVYQCPESIREIVVVGRHLGDMDKMKWQGKHEQTEHSENIYLEAYAIINATSSIRHFVEIGKKQIKSLVYCMLTT